MGEKFKNSNFYKKLKELTANRAAVLTAITLVLALTLLTTLVLLTNRAKKLDATEQPSENNGGSIDSDASGAGNAEDETDGDVSTAAPVFSVAPVEGACYMKGHDATLQVYSSTTNDYRVHLGLDLLAKENAPVYAAEAGTVTQIWEDPMMGWCVAVSHAGEYCTFYKNLSKELADGIETGVSVSRGQQIGNVGSSAWLEVAEEPHLHFEMTLSGVSVNPAEHMTKDILDRMQYDMGYEDK